MTRVSVADARKALSEILNRAAYAHQRTIITRHDEDLAAIISIDELRLLDALIQMHEDKVDLADARSALMEARDDGVAWDAIKSEFDL